MLPLELAIRESEGRFDLADFAQPDPGKPREDWQVPYAESSATPRSPALTAPPDKAISREVPPCPRHHPDFATSDEIRSNVEDLGGMVELLKVTQPKLRSRFYEEIGLTGTFDPTTRSVAAAELGVRMGRVGGGT